MRRVMMLALTVVSGCKPPTAAETKSLDNFARSSEGVNPNICYGDFADATLVPRVEIQASLNRDPEPRKALEAAVVLALTAVPDAFRSLVSAFPGSVIRLVDDAGKSCPGSMSKLDRLYAAEGGKLQACWNGQAETIEIYLEAKPEVIQHHLVRMYARAAAGLIAESAFQATPEMRANVPRFVASVATFRQIEARIAKIFVDEVEAKARRGSVQNLDAFKPLVSGGADERRAFDHYVFAEAFDSYYCNGEPEGTRARFLRDLPQTFAAFAEYAHSVEADRKFLETVKQAQREPARAEFGLADTWDPLNAKEGMAKAKAGVGGRLKLFQALTDTNSTEAQRTKASQQAQKGFYDSLGDQGKRVQAGEEIVLSPIGGAGTGADLAKGNVGKAVGGQLASQFMKGNLGSGGNVIGNNRPIPIGTNATEMLGPFQKYGNDAIGKDAGKVGGTIGGAIQNAGASGLAPASGGLFNFLYLPGAGPAGAATQAGANACPKGLQLTGDGCSSGNFDWESGAPTGTIESPNADPSGTTSTTAPASGEL